MDTPTPPPTAQPPPPTEQHFRVGPLIRDVVIIVALTSIGSFVIGLVARLGLPLGMVALAASNLLLGTVGFVISGCLAVGNRWRHLAYVAVGVWLAAFTNVLFFGFAIVEWLFGVIAVALMMGLGGAISYVFNRDARPSP